MSTLSLGERVVRSAWRLAPQRTLSGVVGWGAKRALPKSVRSLVLKSFARKYEIDLEEAEWPLDQYTSLQEFFTRKLRPGARPVATDANAVVAPSDGVVCDAGVVAAGTLLEAKGSAFSLSDLLADGELAARLEGGPYLVTYLSPRDYHRVHAPVTGKIVGWTHIPGRLFPVGSRSVAREAGLFARNERFVTIIDGAAGLSAVVMVAAVGVGHITASYDPEVATHAPGFATGLVRRKRFADPPRIGRGDELGVFNLGSTTIAVFEPRHVVLEKCVVGSAIRMGSAVGSLVPSSSGVTS
jgi:phosphatidylserine decarboxylase